LTPAGNIIIRPNPQHPDQPQLVLLDHGLYVRVTDTFKRQYATLWKALLATDYGTIERVTKEWGIGTPDLFASATLLKPVHYKNGNGGAKDEAGEELDQYEQSVRMKAKLKAFLTDTDKWPKELIFLGRNMRSVPLVLTSELYADAYFCSGFAGWSRGTTSP
jgi:aarF domain-containing kinase